MVSWSKAPSSDPFFFVLISSKHSKVQRFSQLANFWWLWRRLTGASVSGSHSVCYWNTCCSRCKLNVGVQGYGCNKAKHPDASSSLEASIIQWGSPAAVADSSLVYKSRVTLVCSSTDSFVKSELWHQWALLPACSIFAGLLSEIVCPARFPASSANHLSVGRLVGVWCVWEPVARCNVSRPSLSWRLNYHRCCFVHIFPLSVGCWSDHSEIWTLASYVFSCNAASDKLLRKSGGKQGAQCL